MTTELDPQLRQRFEQNLADHEASVARVDATLSERQREITEQAAKADAKFDAERGELLTKMKEEFKQPEPESDKSRLVGWSPSESIGRPEGLMSFDAEDDPVDTPPRPQARPPVVAAPPAAPARAARHRRVSESDEDDYSEQSWLRE
ncbi:MAG TPA: hypothetical protein VHX38_33630 [Pseudonocardiaceae bacterium]|jgi:hypothetical protein|nr:hypothetical protein [Pseudonocardiaceae bacterium]